MTNEYGAELDRNGYAPSIVQDDTDCCYICYGCHQKLDRHEVLHDGTKKTRDKCKRLGLWVTLCHKDHHIFGPGAVHQNHEVDLALKQAGQMAAMEHYGWTECDFIREFGRNYL